MITLGFPTFSAADDDDERDRSTTVLTIDSASWDSREDRLRVSGTGVSYERVTVTNADTGEFIDSDRVYRSSWSIRQSMNNNVPCSVRAEQSDGQVATAPVANAPSDCDGGTATPNIPPESNAGSDQTLTLTDGQSTVNVTLDGSGSSDADGSVVGYTWTGNPDPANIASPSLSLGVGSYTFTLVVTDDAGATSSSDTVQITINDAVPLPAVPDVSINSTSQNGRPNADPVSEQPLTNPGGYKLFAVNDLGMHCGDFDTRISSILPPFNVLHATVVERGGEPNVLSPADGVELVYSAASNPSDPILSGINSAGDGQVYSSMVADGSVYKTNFWEVVRTAYDPFYPPDVLAMFYDPNVLVDEILDLGLPAPNVEQLYLGDGSLVADQQAMPGISGPYSANNPQLFEAYVMDQAFFTDPDFQFGYVSEGVNWFEAAGIPLTAFDDYGRENPWPLYRVQALLGGNVIASTDAVVPISGEANCGACHNASIDGGNGTATNRLGNGNVFEAFDDPQYGEVPLEVSKEYAADINLVRLHDLKHGTALEAETPVVCQRCHYTPALDLAQLGPLGAGDALANGREQTSVKSMSNVMHSHHGNTVDSNGNPLFPAMPAAVKDEFGVQNEGERRNVLMETCYQCHPGRRTDCLRGAMANGGMLCQDCHGDMTQVGNDFSRNVSASTPGAFELGGDFYTNPDQPRVPWANEPGCGSCHTGDAMDNMAGDTDTVVNPFDADGNPDNIRLFRAYLNNDPKATPIVPTNKRFAENVIEADNPAVTGSDDPRIGNPMLYRVSTGHEGIFCEACHGSTHGIWPNKNPLSNDNVTANQLQGHKGTITECSTCHDGDLGSTLGGPHGMHPVGDTRFSNGGHEGLAERNKDACRACHGRNGEGTVLSRAAADRVLSNEGRTVSIAKGDMVNCTHCHENEL